MVSARTQLQHLLDIPINYTIFFMSGDLATQRSGICYNLLGENKQANVVTTGKYSEQAKSEMEKHAKVKEVASNAQHDRKTIGEDWQLEQGADIFHYCDVEPQEAFEFKSFPLDKIPDNQILVADMSLSLTTKQVDWSKYGVVYADATKQLGLPGLVIVIVRNDLIGKQKPDTPAHLNW